MFHLPPRPLTIIRDRRKTTLVSVCLETPWIRAARIFSILTLLLTLSVPHATEVKPGRGMRHDLGAY